MTFADDFATEEQSLAEDYPSAFGITFTPQVTGVVIAVAGIALAVYSFINFVQPAQKKYQEAVTRQEELKGQLNKIKTGDLQLKLAQLESDLAAKKVLKSRVLSMFTNENDLETLLLDLNSFITSNQGVLTQYQPDSNITTIDDASLGTEVQDKLKRQGISLTIEGTFNETKQILQDLERLQPLLMVQSISSSVEEQPTAILTSSRGEIVPQKQAQLKTQIKLDAILPLSQAELEKAKEADAKAEEAEKAERRNNRRKSSENNTEETESSN